jgi:hypothetical protein
VRDRRRRPRGLHLFRAQLLYQLRHLS